MHKLFWQLVVVAFLVTVTEPAAIQRIKPTKLSPVIFMPGNGGSQLEARIREGVPASRFGCAERKGWFRLWLNVWDFLAGKHCMVMKVLQYQWFISLNLIMLFCHGKEYLVAYYFLA